MNFFQRYFLILIFSIFLFNQTNAQQFTGSILSSEIKEQITFLASDSLKGRKPGSNESKIAAQYILKSFENGGLKLLEDNGYQYFDMVTDMAYDNNCKLKINKYNAILDTDFVPFTFSSSDVVKSKVVFAGYGFDISNKNFKWNDYENIDVEGKWVMILSGFPNSEKNKKYFEQNATERHKVLTAKDKGAKGVLIISAKNNGKKDELYPFIFDNSPSDVGIPVISISRKLSNIILQKTKKNIDIIESEIISSFKPNSFKTNQKLSSTIKKYKTVSRVQNIVAMVEGRDPEAKNEYIVVGAHYDHLGYGGVNSGSRNPDLKVIHNGADDNASGTSGIIELAQAFANRKKRPDNSLIFVAFDAEEMGLVGSKHFVKNPPVPLNKIKGMVNLDMIGRFDKEKNSIYIGGTGTSKQSEKILDELDKKHSFKLNYSKEGYGPSDHASFYSENIPVFYVTTGANEDYHTQNDDSEFINFDGQVLVLNFVYDLIDELAMKSTNLTFTESGEKNDNSNHRYELKVSLGIIPDMISSNNNGLRVDGVRKDGPAYKSGIKKGDIIIAINQMPINNIYEYMARLKSINVGDKITVEFLRNNNKQSTEIQF